MDNRTRAELIARDCALFVEAQEEIEISDIVGPRVTSRGVATMANLIYLALERPDEYPPAQTPHDQPASDAH